MKKRIVIKERLSISNWDLDKLTAIISDIQDWLESVPAEYRDSAAIDVYFGDDNRFNVFYEREETKEEENARILSENNRYANVRQRELLELKRLREKYPDEV
jgi:hypothetical protein